MLGRLLDSVSVQSLHECGVSIALSGEEAWYEVNLCMSKLLFFVLTYMFCCFEESAEIVLGKWWVLVENVLCCMMELEAWQML